MYGLADDMAYLTQILAGDMLIWLIGLVCLYSVALAVRDGLIRVVA